MDLASLLVVTRNNGQIIEHSLSSIFSQSYKNIEVVIVDSSDDGSSSIIKRCIDHHNTNNFDVAYLYMEAEGVGVARNAAINNSSGKYLFFIDADFYINEDYVERAVELFSKDNKILSIDIRQDFYPSKRGIFSEAILLFEKARQAINPRDRFEFWVCQKKIFDIVGFFVSNLEAGEDGEWDARANRILKKMAVDKGYKAAVAPEIVLYEEKQGWSISKYWKKLVWYGAKYADLNYFRSTLITSTIEFVLILTQLSFPFILFYHISINSLGYFVLIPIISFLAPTLFIAIKAVKRKIASRSLILIPLLTFYKSFFLFVGFFSKLLGDFRARVNVAVKGILA